MRLRLMICTCVAMALGVSSTARADLRTFVIDPGQTSLSLSGSAFSAQDPALSFEEQSAGSLTTAANGSIVADFLANSIELTGSNIALTDNGSWLPGATPANYGFQADTLSDLFGAMTGAVRDAEFAMTSPVIGTTPAGSGFSFPISTAALLGTAGVIDFDGSPPTSVLGQLIGVSQSLTGVSPTEWGATVADATYETDGTTETLTIPVDVRYLDFVSTAELDWQLEGTIVATRTIPEPASIMLLAFGAVAFWRRK